MNRTHNYSDTEFAWCTALQAMQHNFVVEIQKGDLTQAVTPDTVHNMVYLSAYGSEVINLAMTEGQTTHTHTANLPSNSAGPTPTMMMDMGKAEA